MNELKEIALYMFGFDLMFLVLVLEIYVFVTYILPCGFLVSIVSLLGIASVDFGITTIIDTILESQEELHD